MDLQPIAELAVIPLTGTAGYLAIRQSVPVRATKVVRTLYDPTGKRPKQPKLRHLRWGRRGWLLAYWMPVGADSAEWQANSDKLSEALRASVRIAYEDGLVWMRLGSRRIPSKVSYASFYRGRRPRGKLQIGVGKSQEGRIWVDLRRVIHLLVGGGNGGGKSTLLRQAIIYLAETHDPHELRLSLIDLKGRGAPELRIFESLPHVDGPVVSDLEGAKDLLLELEADMNQRYQRMADAGCVDVEEYNRKNPFSTIPSRVVFIDEFADLTTALSGPEQRLLERLVRETRAADVHFVMATQRPDANVVPGQIRNNVGAVCGFRTGNRFASEVMLGAGRFAAASLPLSPGLGVWQEDQSTELRVRAIFLSAEEARQRVQLLSSLAISSSPSSPKGEGELSRREVPVSEPAQRLALSPSGIPSNDERRPLTRVGHAVLERVSGTKLPVTSRVLSHWQEEGRS